MLPLAPEPNDMIIPIGIWVATTLVTAHPGIAALITGAICSYFGLGFFGGP